MPATKTKRYNLALPDDLFEEVERLATEEHISVAEVLRRFVKLGLIAARADRSPDMALMIRDGESVKEVIFL